MPDKVKIAFDAERMKYPDTGLYHYCLHLGNALLRHQADYNVDISFFLRKAQTEVFGKNARIIPQHSLQKFWMPSTGKYDVWHTTYQATNYFPANAKSRLILTIHDLNFLHEPKTPQKRSSYLKKLKQKIDRSDEVTAISWYVKREIEEYIGSGNKQVHVIYNGSNIVTGISPAMPKFIPPGPFFFTIGTVVTKKNFHVLPGLLQNNDFYLVIAGRIYDNEYAEKIKSEAKRLGVENRVVLTGPVTEPQKYWYLENCSAFAFPSLAEGFGLPVIEAMHFGKPVLLSPSTSLPEIGGEVASYFESFEPEHMAALAMKTLHELTDEKKQAYRDRAAQFDWDTSARQYLALYVKNIR